MAKKPHLTTTQADAIQEYIWQIRDLMNLRHWDAYVTVKAAPEGANASVHPVDGRLVAPISVARDWWTKRTPEEKRNDIVHELIHVIHRDQTDLVRLVAHKALRPASYVVLAGAHKLATEVMVDHLASIIAPTMPLPDFPQED